MTGEFQIVFKEDDARQLVVLDLEQKSMAALLMASYINAIIRAEGITCDATEIDPLVWDMETQVSAWEDGCAGWGLFSCIVCPSRLRRTCSRLLPLPRPSRALALTHNAHPCLYVQTLGTAKGIIVSPR